MNLLSQFEVLGKEGLLNSVSGRGVGNCIRVAAHSEKNRDRDSNTETCLTYTASTAINTMLSVINYTSTQRI